MIAPISWGTTYVVTTELLPAGRPLFVAAVRVVPAGLLLVAVGSLMTRWRPRGAEWWRTAVLGVALVVARPGAQFDSIGILAALAANVSFSLGVVLTKRFPAPAHRLASTGWQLLLGGLVLVPLALVVEGSPPPLSMRNTIGFAQLGLVGTALAFVLWFRGIERLPTAAPPLLGLAAPVTGALLGWVVLSQSLSVVQLLGFVITIGAIAWGATRASAGAGGAAEPVEEPRPQPRVDALAA